VPRGIFVRLPEPERSALLDFADREWRDPRVQAAMFVVEGLRRAGVLPEEPQRTDLATVGQK
jgi:hypothetical protein